MIQKQDRNYIIVCAFMTMGKTAASLDREDVWDCDFGLYRQFLGFKKGPVPLWVQSSYATTLMAHGGRFKYVCVNDPYVCQGYFKNCVLVLPTFSCEVFEQRLRQRSLDGSADMYYVSNFNRFISDWRKIATQCGYSVIETDELSKALNWLDHNGLPTGGSVITVAS